MEGTIGVESAPGFGSVFWFELPSVAAPDVAGDRASLLRESSIPVLGGRAHTLLYVEDNPANLRLVEQIIARHPNISLTTAVTADVGIELARVQKPDVILMDINLPGMNGIQALKVLRADPLTRSIPVIAVSANAMPSDIKRALNAGFVRYITKPINIAEFMDALECAFNGRPQATLAGVAHD
jgi:CheY-like chemotaxis protein